MIYDHDGDALVWHHPVGTHTLSMRADEVRKERTGVHALVDISLGTTTLAWGVCNVDKDEDRVRLANSAFARINGQSDTLPDTFDKSEMKRCFDGFCRGLWEESVGNLAPIVMAGSAEPRPTSFVLRPYLVEGGGTILFAHPGRGKSYTTLMMAVSIDAGDAIPSARRLWPVQQRRVLWINLERSKRGVEDRLGNINAALGLPRDRPLLTMNARGRSLSDVLPAARRAVRDYRVGVVLLDSISRAGLGDLTENNPVNKIMDAMNGLVETWFGVAHAPRNSDEHLYGSIHFEAGADVVVRLLSQQEEGGPLGVGLQITKENDVGKQPAQILALEFGPHGLVGARPAKKGEFPEVEAGKKPTMRQAVRDYLLSVGDATATTVALVTGFARQNVSSLLAHDDTFVATRKEGRDQFYGVRAS